MTPTHETPPVVLSIAGTDSGGAAGTAADLTTFAAPGTHGACVLTAVTAQDTTGVRAVHDHPRNISDEEIDAIAATGGTIGVMFSPVFLAGRWRADSTCILDHIDHIFGRAQLRCLQKDHAGQVHHLFK